MQVSRMERTKMNNAYISGPITGVKDFNKPLFDKTAKRWRDAGWTVTNPHDLDNGDYSRNWVFYLRRDIKALMDCDVLVELPDSFLSPGAQLERHIAERLGMPIYGHNYVHAPSGKN